MGMQAETPVRMQDVDVRTVNREELTDMQDIIIEETAAPEEKLRSYLDQVRNPYVLKAGEYVLKLSFAEGGKCLEDRIADYIQDQAKIRI